METPGDEEQGSYREYRRVRWLVPPCWRTLARAQSTSALLVIFALTGCAGLRAAEPISPAPVPSPAPAAPVTTAPASHADLLEGREFMVPVDGVEPRSVRDTFGAPRGSRVHGAFDIMAPRGTPVLAAAAGRIFKLRSNEAGGITIYALDREEQLVFYYAHLDGYREGLEEGMPIEAGDVIGYVGMTGNAPPNTPHLHFQVMRYRGDGRWWDGEPLNVHQYFVKRGKRR